jgi:hypothetical protein
MSLAVCAFLGLLKFMKVDSNIDLQAVHAFQAKRVLYQTI